MSDQALYERLGGIYSIAAVVDELVLTTLWVAEAAGGPYKYVSTKPNDDSLDLEPTHFGMKLTEEEFAAAGRILSETLDQFEVPEREKGEVISAFMAHKDEVISGTSKS